MNQLAPEKQKAILQGYNQGLGIRTVADIVECSPITVRTHLRKNGNQARTISEGMIKWHQFRRGELSYHIDIDRKIPQNLTEICVLSIPHKFPESVKCLPCGHPENYCVNCRDIFSEGCEFNARPKL